MGAACSAEANIRGVLAQAGAVEQSGSTDGVRLKVFCASLADWLDNKAQRSWRVDLAALIAATPNLDWLC